MVLFIPCIYPSINLEMPVRDLINRHEISCLESRDDLLLAEHPQEEPVFGVYLGEGAKGALRRGYPPRQGKAP